MSTGTTCGFIFFSSFEPFWILCRNLWHGSQNSIYVSRVKFAEEIFFVILPFWNFSDFERKRFQTFGQKTSCICQNYLLRVQRNNLWLEFFLSFESFPIFCRNLRHGSQISIYVSRVKFAEKIVFFVFPFRNFSDFEQNTFRLLAKKLQKFVKINFCVSTGTTCGFIFFSSFEPFWILCRNLWHGSQNSIYVSRVKFAEEIFFVILPFWNFSDFERKRFQTFGQKTSCICQNYLLRVQRNNLWLEFFLSFESFPIFCRNHWHGSQISIYVSRVKIAEKNIFFCFLSRNFSNFEQKFFRLLAKKLQEIIKTTFCLCRWTIFGLKKLLKVLNLFGFSAETFGKVLKILSTCPE